jgi:hypothetical protein
MSEASGTSSKSGAKSKTTSVTSKPASDRDEVDIQDSVSQVASGNYILNCNFVWYSTKEKKGSHI